MGNYTILQMFENPWRGRQARNFTTNVPKILDRKSSSEEIFSENCRWVPLICMAVGDKTLNRAQFKKVFQFASKFVVYNIRRSVLGVSCPVTFCTCRLRFLSVFNLKKRR